MTTSERVNKLLGTPSATGGSTIGEPVTDTGLGGTEMDRARAGVIRDMIKISEGSDRTRSDILDEINKSRVAEGKAPVKVDWKDVAAVDKEQAVIRRNEERDFEGKLRDLASPEPTKPVSGDALTAEKLREAARVRESKSPKQKEPTLSDLLAVSDAAVEEYNKSGAAQTGNPAKVPAGSADRTLIGDLIAGERALGRVALKGVEALTSAGSSVARMADRASTDAMNYLRTPGQAKVLTAEELRNARRKLANQ
jgi:hypothetical protein